MQNTNTATTQSLRARIIEMQPGQEIEVPIATYRDTTVRSYASDLSFTMQRSYRVQRDRARRIYIVRREA